MEYHKEPHSEKHPKDGPKQKGVPAEPHPLDRHSGTGRGYIKKQKKNRENLNFNFEKDKYFNVQLQSKFFKN